MLGRGLALAPTPIFFTPTRATASSIIKADHLRVGSSHALESSIMASEPESDTVVVSEGEWQRWGTSSPLPSTVADVIKNLKSLEKDFDQQMSFGGIGGKLKGNFKVQEDKKHRAVYQSLDDPEQKLQFFSARQVACRLLGSRGYLCQKCWLPMEDCMCSKLMSSSLWHGIRFWLYMHPKDFLRQNNTGKLLWQIFGIQAASMCLFGIPEHEEIMWDSFRLSGKCRVCFLYPNKNASPKSVQDVFDSSLTKSGGHTMDCVGPLNFVLIDGTWSNSAAMYRRLKDKWTSLWGKEDLPCVSLSTTGASVMHKLSILVNSARIARGWLSSSTCSILIHDEKNFAVNLLEMLRGSMIYMHCIVSGYFDWPLLKMMVLVSYCIMAASISLPSL